MGSKHWSLIIYPAPCQAWNTKRDNFPTPSTQQMTDVIDVNTVEMVSTSCIQFSVSGTSSLFLPPTWVKATTEGRMEHVG